MPHTEAEHTMGNNRVGATLVGLLAVFSLLNAPKTSAQAGSAPALPQVFLDSTRLYVEDLWDSVFR